MEQEAMGSRACRNAQTESTRAKKKTTKGKGISIAKNQTNLKKKTKKGNSAKASTHVTKGKAEFTTSLLTIGKNGTKSSFDVTMKELDEYSRAIVKKIGLLVQPSREEFEALVLDGPDHNHQICIDMNNASRGFMDSQEEESFHVTTPPSSEEEDSDMEEDGKKQPGCISTSATSSYVPRLEAGP